MPAAVPSALTSILSTGERLATLYPQIYEYAGRALGAACSVLFEYDADAATLRASLAGGLEELPLEPWRPTAAERDVLDAAFRARTPQAVARLRARLPSLARLLNTPAAVVVPLTRETRRLGVLALGLPAAPGPEVTTAAAALGDAIALALERTELQRDVELHRHIRALLLTFSRSLPSPVNLATGLEILCHDANRAFGAQRTSVWLHERRLHQLVLAASSDPVTFARGGRISTEDPRWPAARAMRRPRSEIAPMPSDRPGEPLSLVTVPLRGRRRALGTLLIEGVRLDVGEIATLLTHADDLGHQLSSTLENVYLLEEVLRSRRELENTFNSIADLVAVCDRRLCLVHANQAFAARLGQTREEVLDRPLASFVGPDTAAWIAQLDLVSAGGPANPVTRQIEDQILRGTFSITLTTLINHDGEPVGVVMVARDITEQARLAAERAMLRERLTQSEKLAALGQFVAGIAHELNNPLQAVLGHIELLRATGTVPREVRREFRTVFREAERAAKIVRNLLVFAGSRRLSRRRISLNAVISRALALRAGLWREMNVEVVRHHDEELPRLPGDPLLLQQAFLNIVINAEQALAATATGGRIEISTWSVPDRRVVVAQVRDTGPGIPAEILPRIFEPFFTTKDVGQGTGLGLAITYGIIQEHGGEIHVENHPDGGAVFAIELPLD